MKLFTILMTVLIFLFGWYASLVYSDLSFDFSRKEVPFASDKNNKEFAPADRVKENQILVFDDKILINVEDASWSTYMNTNSMLPVIDKGANGLELVPKSEDEIQIGDIVAYESSYVNGLVVHRVIDISEDSKGKYFILKGDSNKEADPEKVRFSQIRYVLIGVIY